MTSNIPLTDVTDLGQGPASTKETNRHDGKIYIRSITGFFQQIRKYTLSIQLLMYFSFVWITIDGQPLIFFDLESQKFHLFGIVFWPQDFTLLAFALIISAFGMFFVTALYGRVWCGYSCPQTAWAFMFMWLEEFFEGSRNQRIKLDSQGVGLAKWIKKSSKHLSWILLSLATALTFVGYFYPIRELLEGVFTFTLDSLATWFWVFFFTAATYLNAGWLREKVCIYMCPYSRFQSVMLNEDSLVISYDKKRGEPRAHRAKNSNTEKAGDCIDCRVCVQVCPVGIDIRDGLQYECIGCALCIDACDGIMEKLNLDKGLIRYASENELETDVKSSHWDARTLGYGAMMLVAIVTFSALLLARPQLELSVLRDRGVLFNDTGKGTIENSYLLKIVNKREIPDTYSISVSGVELLSASISEVSVDAGEVKMVPITLEADPELLRESSTNLVFSIVSSSKQGNEDLASEAAIASATASASSKFLRPSSY